MVLWRVGSTVELLGRSGSVAWARSCAASAARASASVVAGVGSGRRVGTGLAPFSIGIAGVGSGVAGSGSAIAPLVARALLAAALRRWCAARSRAVERRARVRMASRVVISELVSILTLIGWIWRRPSVAGSVRL